MKARVQEVGQKLVDPSEKLRREAADRKKEQAKWGNAIPKIATSVAKSNSKKSSWESGSDGSRPESNRSFGSTLLHAHAKISSSAIPAPTAFETSGVQHDPRERKSGARQRKAK